MQQLSHPSTAISALLWLVAPLHLRSLVLLVLARAFPPCCSLASWQVSWQKDVASYLPMRNTLPSYKSPQGGKELAAKESESLGGGRLACFCVVMLAESLARLLETGAGTAPEGAPRGGSASQALWDHLEAGSIQAAPLTLVGKGKGSWLAERRGRCWCAAFAALSLCGARALSNVWARQRKGQEGLSAPRDVRRAALGHWCVFACRSSAGSLSTDGQWQCGPWELHSHCLQAEWPLNLIANIHLRHHCNGY